MDNGVLVIVAIGLIAFIAILAKVYFSGKKSGYRQGHHQGHSKGQKSGYKHGNHQGYVKGKRIGSKGGYKAGKRAGTKKVYIQSAGKSSFLPKLIGSLFVVFLIILFVIIRAS